MEVCPILTLQFLKLVGVEIARSPGWWANKIPLGKPFIFFNCGRVSGFCRVFFSSITTFGVRGKSRTTRNDSQRHRAKQPVLKDHIESAAVALLMAERTSANVNGLAGGQGATGVALSGISWPLSKTTLPMMRPFDNCCEPLAVA